MRLQINHIVIFLTALLALNSCALFKPKCPIPNCNIAQEHQHNLIFDKKAMKENEKKRKGEVKDFNDEQDASLEDDDSSESDSLSLAEGVGAEGVDSNLEGSSDSTNVAVEKEPKPKKEKKRKKNKEVAGGEEISSDSVNSGEEVIASSKKKKKKKKKSKEEGQEEDLDEATLEAMSVDSDTAAVDDAVDNTLSKKEVRNIEKNTKSELTESEKEAKRIEDELQKSWRSRITAWFKKNQKPKIGEHWKGPVKKKDTPDFRVWPKVRIWPFDKEKVYTKY